MASRITHIAIKSPRFYFLKIKCTFFLVVETKRKQEKNTKFTLESIDETTKYGDQYPCNRQI